MTNISQKAVLSLPPDLREGIANGLLTHGKVKVIGLGIFEIRKVKGRTGHNPATGKPMEISSYNKVAFKPTANLKRKFL